MLRHAFVTAFLLFIMLGGAAFPAEISPDLQAQISKIDAGESVPVLILFKQRVDLSAFTGGRSTAGNLILALQADAAKRQARVMDYLRDQSLDDDAKSFWINNSIALRATRAQIEALSAFEDVAGIKADAPVRPPELEEGPAGHAAGGRDYHWNLEIMRVNEVWDTFGLSGDGILFGLMDSGAEIDHPALQGKWRGGHNSWYDLINGLPDPYDDHGHGTRVTAVLVGGDGPGPFTEDVGIAYNGKFIAAKIFNQSGGGATESVVTDAAQWLLDPDGLPATDDFPHITSNSFLLPSHTETFFHPIAAAWRAAGIIPVCAIGNSGPASETTFPPGNYNNTIGVGATTAADQPWSASSRGPSPAGSAFPTDRRKPDVATPGQAVYSAGLNGSYSTFDGTSMATPHTAGTVALMMEADPSLTFEEIYDKLIGSAATIPGQKWGLAGEQVGQDGQHFLFSFRAYFSCSAHETGSVHRADLIQHDPALFAFEPAGDTGRIGAAFRGHRRDDDGPDVTVHLVGRYDQAGPHLFNFPAHRRIEADEIDVEPADHHVHSSSSQELIGSASLSRSTSSPASAIFLKAAAQPARGRSDGLMTR